MILDIRLMTCKFGKYLSCVSQYMLFANVWQTTHVLTDMIGKCLSICS